MTFCDPLVSIYSRINIKETENIFYRNDLAEINSLKYNLFIAKNEYLKHMPKIVEADGQITSLSLLTSKK